MKRVLVLFLLFFICATALFAQEQQVKVTLKNGTTMVGELVSIDPVGSIEIKISGVECKVSMTEVANVEPVTEEVKGATIPDANKMELGSALYGDYLVTDTADYPDSIVVSICDKKFTLILVRGGMFNMGYDGNGSLSMNSEPVHRVELSSFYVSKNLITDDVAYNFIEKKMNEVKNYQFVTRIWDEAKQVVDGMAKQEGIPYRLLTEAEWEYSAIQPVSELIFKELIASELFSKEKFVGEWCNDFKGDYIASKQINPQGPKIGKDHIVRSFAYDKTKWSRNTNDFCLNRHTYTYYETYNYIRDNNNYAREIKHNFDCVGYYVRFAISADNIDKIK